MKKIFFIMIVYVLACIGCYILLEKDKIVATQYLNSKRYRIIAYAGNLKFKLTEDMLIKSPHMGGWVVQNEEPNKYIGKTVDVEKFLVTNHPLDKWESKARIRDIRSKGKTKLVVWIVDGKAIGGLSAPFLGKESLIGAIWSLDGKTFKEIHPDLDYYEFRAYWISRFYKPPVYNDENSLTFQNDYDALKKELIYARIIVEESDGTSKTVRIIRDKGRLVQMVREFDRLNSRAITKEKYPEPDEFTTYTINIWREGTSKSYIVLNYNSTFYYEERPIMIVKRMPDSLIELLGFR